MLDEDDYDLALLDIMGVKGLDLLDVAAERNVPAVMFTAPAINPDYLLKSIERGAILFIPKHDLVNLDELITEVLSIIDNGESPLPHTIKRLEPLMDEFFPASWKAKCHQICQERVNGDK